MPVQQWHKTLYRAYLTSDHWKKLRQQIRRKNPCCYICRTRRRLHPHRLTYQNLWPASLLLDGFHDLVMLCERHHKGLHAWAAQRKVKPNRVALQGYYVWMRFN